MKREKTHKKTGFTLLELLTTIGVIAILLGFLIPALNMVQKSAVTAKQKAQFHGIEIALEAFSTDIGDYPPSTYDDNSGTDVYTGSQMLAEAMVGRDGLGYHSESTFSYSGMIPPLRNLYYPNFVPADTTERDNNLALRKGPYLELESANAIKLSDLYGTGNHGSLIDSYVLVDMFKQVKHKTTGKQVGMPILYYKANTREIGNSSLLADYSKNTYNFEDARCDGYGIPTLPVPFSGSVTQHPMEDDPAWFYEAIKNPNFTTPVRPYRSESFIFQSAGPDGLYGTGDDVFNFDSEK